VSDLERVGWNNDLSEVFAQKIPCESNCPYMVVTDTLDCRKELEGLVDMEEVRGAGRCPFWPHKDLRLFRDFARKRWPLRGSFFW